MSEDRDCEHRLVHASVFLTGEMAEKVALWSCDFCQLRFYPACPVCVDVGHRNVVHRATPAPDPGAGLREAAKDVVAKWDRAVLGAVSGGYGPLNAEFGEAADAIKVLRAALAPSAEPPETA